MVRQARQEGGRAVPASCLLVPALHAAVSVVEVHHVASAVAQDLHLDVPGLRHVSDHHTQHTHPPTKRERARQPHASRPSFSCPGSHLSMNTSPFPKADSASDDARLKFSAAHPARPSQQAVSICLCGGVSEAQGGTYEADGVYPSASLSVRPSSWSALVTTLMPLPPPPCAALMMTG